MGEIVEVMAREPFRDGLAVFLAGPTPERGTVPSWRPEARRQLGLHWIDHRVLTVYNPESRRGVRAKRYEDQVHWEAAARHRATVVLFWIPRDMMTLPGMTTNVEFGYDIASRRRVVLGAPLDCPNPERNRYLVYLANANGVPVRRTLPDTVAAAIELIQSEKD